MDMAARELARRWPGTPMLMADKLRAGLALSPGELGSGRRAPG